MGSSSNYHIVSNRQNRQLQEGLRRHDRFKLQSNPYKNLSYKPENINVEKADKLRQRKILFSFAPVAFICIVTFFFISKIPIDNKSRSLSKYHLLIKKGKESFDEGLYGKARVQFQTALKIYPNGKSANLGLTKCLLISCTEIGINCQYAEEYYSLITNCGLLSKNELKNLEYLKTGKFNWVNN